MSNDNEAIAIIGMGCRFPGGASTPEALWELLAQERSGISEAPEDRWNAEEFVDWVPDRIGKTYVSRAGYLRESVEEFDPAPFGLSARDCERLDPQQMLLLEVAWSALEDAGIPTNRIRGEKVAVFVGGFTQDHTITQLATDARELVDPRTPVSILMTLLAARLSHVFDLRGASASLDTACSSSLVALHLACEELRLGRSKLALAGGVNVICRPEVQAAMAQGRFLAPDAQCKSFDARANGYVRGEGAGMLLLKPLVDARRDEDLVLAVIRATGVGQDGRTPGITVPSETAQRELLQEVCSRAGVERSSIAFAEAHGTGTPVGDPIEAHALAGALREKNGAPESGGTEGVPEPLVIGSVKANVGHLEAAAGVAGVIKAVLSLQRRVVPRQITFQEPNPAIPFAALGLRVADSATPVGHDTTPLRAVVNSFGYGGTNACAVLEAAPQLETSPGDDKPNSSSWPLLLPLSAASRESLQVLAGLHARKLQAQEDDVAAQWCAAVVAHRSQLRVRRALVAADRPSLCASLETLEHDESAGEPPQVAQRVAFVYSGMGPQWWEMGQWLHANSAVYRNAVTECDRIFFELSGWSVLKEMLTSEATSRMSETQVAQPANFLIQIGLTQLLCDCGIKPAACVGHSVGEVAASYIAGHLTLRDAVATVYHRSRVQAQAAGQGAMLAVGLPPNECAEALSKWVSVAAHNSPNATTLAGKREELERFAELMDQRGVFTRFLRVEVPYHSPYMDRLRAELKLSLAGLSPQTPRLALYSTVSASLLDEPQDGDYWCSNMREPVRFKPTIDVMLKDGVDLFVEIGPHPVLGASIQEIVAQSERSAAVVATLNRKKPEATAFATALAQLFELGQPLHGLPGCAPPGGELRRALPSYPFQRKKLTQRHPAELADVRERASHLLLGRSSPLTSRIWTSTLPGVAVAAIEQHVVDEQIVFPAAAYVETLLGLSREVHCAGRAWLSDIVFHRAMIIERRKPPTVRTTWEPSTQQATIASRDVGSIEWSVHCEATIQRLAPSTSDPLDLSALKASCTNARDPSRLYAALEGLGLRYGSQYRRLRELWCGDGFFLASIDGAFESDPRWIVSPAVLDAALHGLFGLFGDNLATAYLPTEIRSLRLTGEAPQKCMVFGELLTASAERLVARLSLADQAGNVFLTLDGLKLARLGGRSDHALVKSWLSFDTWREAPLDTKSSPPKEAKLAVIGDGTAASESVVKRLQERLGEQFVGSVQRFPSSKDLAGACATAAAQWSALMPCSHIVSLWTSQALDQTSKDVAALSLDVTRDVMALIKELSSLGERIPRLTLLALGCRHDAGDDEHTPSLAPLRALCRSAIAECPELRCRHISLPASPTEAELDQLIDELFVTIEPEVVLADNQRWVSRVSDAPASNARVQVTRHRVDSLAVKADGGFGTDTIRLVPQLQKSSAAAPTELEVLFAGLNFKDLRELQGSSSESTTTATHTGARLGMEAVAQVTRVGSAASNLRVGQRLLLLGRDLLRSRVIPDEEDCVWVPLPDGVDLAAAAGVPWTFCTAVVALERLARLQPGETVLIHEAAAGWGLAATQIAQNIGATVIGTAATDEQRQWLRARGIRQVFDSRSSDYVPQVLEATHGRGTDVILSSGAEGRLRATLELLAPFGRFVEVGGEKLTGVQLPASKLAEGCSFFVADTEKLVFSKPALARQLLARVAELLHDNRVTPVGPEVFPVSDAASAFRCLAENVHTGKVVVDFRRATETEVQFSSQHLDPNGTYVVTGGFGGLGLHIGQWLIDRGARRVALWGRSGASSERARQRLSQWREQGVEICENRLDVSDRSVVAKTLSKLREGTNAIRGIVHTAGVLRDAVISNQTEETLWHVFEPKVRGAWNLHEETSGDDLDFFIMTSSLSVVMGNPGQANYIAANACLDALARHRRGHNLPATSVQLGVIAEVGLAMRNDAVEGHFRRLGVAGMPPAIVAGAMSEVLATPGAVIGLYQTDWEKMPRSPRFSLLQGQHEAAGRDRILELPEEQRLPTVTHILIAEVAKLLSGGSDTIGVEQKLPDLGLDSVLAVELQLRLERILGESTGTLDLLRLPIRSLAEKLLCAIVGN